MGRLPTFQFLKTFYTGHYLFNQTISKTQQIPTFEKEIKTNLTKKEDLDIPEDVVQTILKKLQDFEAKNQFAKKHYTLNSLAKELNTKRAGH